MSVEIQTVTIGDEEDKRLVLTNGQVARTFDYGSSWIWLRVGVFLSYVDTGGDLGSATNLFIGLLSNPTLNLSNGPATSTCSHFVGVYAIGSGTRYTSPIVHQGISGIRCCKKIGSTLTSVSVPNNTIVIPATSGNVRTVAYLDFVKSGGGLSIGVVYCTNGMGLQNIPTDEFINLMGIRENYNISNYLINLYGGYFYSSSPYKYTTLDEATYGYLNSIVISWPYNTGLHISHVIVRKIR